MIEENLKMEWEVRMDRVSQIKQLLPILVVLILLVTIALSIPPKPTGFVTVSDEFNYSDDIDINLNGSYEYIWVVGNYGELTSVRVDGSVSREGSAKIYLEYDNESYLVFDSSRLGESDIINDALIDDESEEIIDLEGRNKQITIKVEGGGSKDIGDVFEFNISSSFNWDVSYDKVCTRWSLTSSNSLNLPTSGRTKRMSHPDAEEGSAELIDEVNEISLCYGSSDCCALIGLESSGDWNSSFYLSYGRYGVELINIIKAQVIYANYSLDIENPYEDVVYSDVKELEAEFYGGMISFEDICIDTCLLPGFNASGYKLIADLNNVVLNIDKIGYSVLEEVTNNAPVLIKNISILNINKDENLTIDLSEYFTDLEGDELTYSYYNVENITISIDNNLATTTPDKGFIGIRYSFFTANDSSLGTVSDLFTINVSEVEVKTDVTPKLKANKKDFGLDEDALFEFEYLSEGRLIKQGKSLKESLKEKQKKKWIAENEIIETFVYDSLGRLVTIEPEIEELREGKFKITLPKQRQFRAGKYRLRIELIKDGISYIEEQEFTWGVLAINTHKSIYLPGELADIGIAVLDDRGHMVCDSSVRLEITNPLNQKTILSTSNGLINVSPGCRVYGVTNLPDYYTDYTVNSVGTYTMNLTAETPNGVRNIVDEFVVRSFVDFDISRKGPTRIYPPVRYIMNFTIKVNGNYNGLINEYVPSSFIITEQAGLTITTIGDTKVLTWNKNLVSGQTYNLYYEFDAPDISPEFYLLGALEIGEFKETRNWQIASDTPGYTYLTDTAVFTWTVPNDWNDADNSIEVIGGGGGGNIDIDGNTGAGGGGGGAYTKITNLDLEPDAVITIQVGDGGPADTSGGDTWFNGSSCALSDACAKGGIGATGIGGAAGGNGLDCVGVDAICNSGGYGGDGHTDDTGGGGGGAGGPNGDGGTGGAGGGKNLGGGGGGGSGGGSDGEAGGIDTDGGDGGNNSDGIGSGAGGTSVAGSPGTLGGGGGGGDKTLNGGGGGDGKEWESINGSGGGGGGAGDNGIGGAGGLYGGGGGGGGTGGAGANGIIVIWYALPADETEPSFSANKTNASATTPTINDVIQINITVTDTDSGVHTIKLATNDTGTMVNESGQEILGGGGSPVTAIFNFTVTANHSVLQWQVWANDSNTDDNKNPNVTIVKYVTVQNSPPTQPTIVYPLDGKNYTNITAINYSSSSDAERDSISYEIYINNSLNTTIYGGNLTQWNASDGFYNLTVVANDGSDSSANSSVVRFRLDSINPSWSGNETNASLMKINGNATFNITVSDYGSGLSYYIFSWNGTGIWDNATNGSISGSSQKLVINKSTNLSQGNTIGYMWYANDSLNQWNNSLLRTFTVANTAPDTPDVIYPSDGKNYTNITAINYSSYDADGDDINYDIYINGSLNTTIVNGNLTQWNASDGFYNLTVTARDNDDSSDNSSVRHFRLDSVAPTVTLIAPANNSYWDIDNTPDFNYSATDANEIYNCSLFINNTFNASFQIDKTPIANFTNTPVENGDWNWSVNCSDPSGNWGFSGTFNLTINVSAVTTCDCPSGQDWVIDDGSICVPTSNCVIGTNKLRILNGGLRINSGINVRTGGCYVADDQSLYVDDNGGLYCEG